LYPHSEFPERYDIVNREARRESFTFVTNRKKLSATLVTEQHIVSLAGHNIKLLLLKDKDLMNMPKEKQF